MHIKNNDIFLKKTDIFKKNLKHFGHSDVEINYVKQKHH